MTDQRDNINLSKHVFDDKKRQNCGSFWTNLLQISDCFFVPTFCDLVDCLWLLSGNSSFKNL